jgi:MFS family permease
MPSNNLLKICSMNFFARLFKGFIFIFVAIYLLGLGMDGLQVGLLASIIPITSLFIGLPTGIVNDRLDIRYTILLGYACFSAFFLGLVFFPDFILLIPLFVLGGIGLNIIEVSYRNYVFKDNEPWHEGRKYGLYTFSDILAWSAGAFLGFTASGFLGQELTLLLIGLYYLAISPLLLLMKPEKVARTRLFQYKKDFFHANNILLSVIVFILATHWGAEMTSYGPFLETVLGLDIIGVGFYYGFSIFFLGLAALVFGNRIDHKTDFKKLFIIGLLISGTAHILMTIPQYYVSIAFRAIHEIGDGVAEVSLLFWLGRKFSKSRIGGDSEIFFVVMTLGNFLGALVYGPIGFAYGYSWSLIIAGITLIGDAGLFYVLKRRLD